MRVAWLACFLAGVLIACDGSSSSVDSDAAPPVVVPPDGGSDGCLPGEGCACESDQDCAGEHCECADATCSARICQPAACDCAYGGDCASPLDDGVRDPNSCTGASMCFDGACIDPDDGPPEPSFPDTIGTVSVIVRTADGDISGTSDVVSLCLTEDHCFELDRPGINDLRTDQIDTFHFEDIGLPRAQVDRMAMSISGADDWEPACIAVRFDGEPVYCMSSVPFVLGDESESVMEWRDPEGLHVDCSSCYGAAITHGPLVGAVTDEFARIWVRTDATRIVGLRLSKTPDFADVANIAPVAAWAHPSPTKDFGTVLEAHGLEPQTTYYYGIEIDGVIHNDPSYTFTTPPRAGAPTTFTFGFGSCAKDSFPQDIFAPIAEAGLDLFLFGGDNNYGDVATLDELRWQHQWELTTPGRASLVASTPTLAVWDDHDFLGNNTDGTDPRRMVARRAFMEYWPNPAYGQNGEGIYFKHSYGDVDFFMLDARFSRDPLDGPVMFGDEEGRASILGAAQTRWLLDELEASTAKFKFLLSGSQWTDHGKTDSWASFTDARDAIFDAIEDRGIEGVVLLSGDRHRAEFRSLPRVSGYDLPELTSSPLANEPRDCAIDDDLLSCHDQGFYVMFLDVDTTVADPVLVATIHVYQDDGSLAPVDEWRIKRSELSFQ